MLVLPLLIKVGVVANYIFQYERYATELCVNQDKPELECNGKCQMMNELNKVEQDNETSPELPVLAKILELGFFTNQGFTFNLSFLSVTYSSWFNLTNEFVLTGVPTEIFQPPRS
jgi:hypothetical protein